MIQIRRPFAIATALFLGGALGACTPSVSASYDGADPFAKPIVPGALAEQPQSKGPGALGAPAPERGSGTVVIALAPGVEFSEEALSAFRTATGFTARTVALGSDEEAAEVGADLVMGLDLLGLDAVRSALSEAPPFELTYPEGVGGAIAGAMPYGRDDVCVLADSGWVSAGQRRIPEGFDGLGDANTGFLLAVPDPASTKSGAFFLLGAASRVSGDLDAWVRALKASGAFIGAADEAEASWTALEQADETAQSAPAHRHPLLVAPMSTIVDTTSTPGIEARAHPLPATCVERYLFAAELANATNPSGARSFLAWLEGGQGQNALAEAGEVYPLDLSSVENTPAHWFLTPMADAVPLTPMDAAGLADRRAIWSGTSAG